MIRELMVCLSDPLPSLFIFGWIAIGVFVLTGWMAFLVLGLLEWMLLTVVLLVIHYAE